MKRILIVEDDLSLSAGLRFDLDAEGYIADTACCAEQGIDLLSQCDYDLIILDVNLPGESGFELCRKVKKQWLIPVIFLTARDLENDQLYGFDLGADDYITKPFSMPLLRKRVAAVLKRAARGGQNVYNDGFLCVNFDKLTASVGGETVFFTPTEYKLLRLFTANTGMVLTKQLALEKIWDSGGKFVDEHALTVNINRLRSKIEDEAHKYIKTIYAMGYQWSGDVI